MYRQVLESSGTCWDFQVPLSWNNKLDQGHVDSGGNSLFRMRALASKGVGQRTREEDYKFNGIIPLELRAFRSIDTVAAFSGWKL